MNQKQKRNLIRILVTAALMAAAPLLPIQGAVRSAYYILCYLLIGFDILKKALHGIACRQPFDETLLMAVASVGAIALSAVRGEACTEAVAVMLFYQIGEWFQSYAVGRSRKSITELMDICPDYANIDRGDGQLERVDPDDVEIGTQIVVEPGEKIPIDGVVTSGTSSIDTAALTGESVPRTAREGDSVISGCINMTGVLRIRTTKEFGESTASKVLELIEDASSRKSRSEEFITKFARIYTPAVVYSALALAVIPPVILILLARNPVWTSWIYRALTFLVISCPCALVISIPLSFFAGIGGASRNGVLVKGSNYLETLANAKTVVFDKTGTLTKGVFEVQMLHPDTLDPKELLHLAAHVERYSNHPIASSIKRAYENEADSCAVENIEEIAGYGVRAEINGKTVCVGNAKFMDRIGAKWHVCPNDGSGTVIHVAVDGVYAGHIVISDVVKPHSAAALRALKQAGVRKTVMLTGDTQKAADLTASELGVDEAFGGLLPQNKVAKVEELIAEKQSPKDTVAFVGDGINDAPVLSRADVGIAMGAMGSDAAIEAADIVLMDDDPLSIATAIRISRKCLRIVTANIWFAIGVKLLCLVLAALGFAGMWLAIFADVGVMILCVLNAVRCMFVKPVKPE